MLAAQNGAVLELTGNAPAVHFGELGGSDTLTLIHNSTDDKLTCSGKIQASDVLIEGTSTTVAQMMSRMATLEQELEAVKQFVGIMPPPAMPPLRPPNFPSLGPPTSPPSPLSPSPANPPPDTATITASSRYSTHTTTGPADALSSWHWHTQSSSPYCDRVLFSASFSRSACGCSSYCYNTATHMLIQWQIGPCAVGEYLFSATTDFGRFGYFEVDSQYAVKSPEDHGVPNDINQRFQRRATLSVNLTEGHHYLRMIGFEDCCDGGNSISFRPPGGSSLSIVTTSSLDALLTC